MKTEAKNSKMSEQNLSVNVLCFHCLIFVLELRSRRINNVPLALTLNLSPKRRRTLNLAPLLLREKGWG
jgi:hypothetical protein